MQSTYVRTATAIDILVDGSSDWIDIYRTKYCPSGAKGMPAHISLVYPFYPQPEITSEVVSRLQNFFIAQGSFECELAEIRTFPQAAYLVPKPEINFRKLIDGLLKEFPGCRPYDKPANENFDPHVTFAQSSKSEELGKLVSDFRENFQHRLPFRFLVKEAQLTKIENGFSSSMFMLPFRSK